VGAGVAVGTAFGTDTRPVLVGIAADLRGDVGTLVGIGVGLGVLLGVTVDMGCKAGVSVKIGTSVTSTVHPTAINMRNKRTIWYSITFLS